MPTNAGFFFLPIMPKVMPAYSVWPQLAGLTDAYSALAARLADGGGKYFFGDQPTSLDAVAFAHLAYHAHSPAGAYTRPLLTST
jgi:glutathione S-transferase